MLNTLEGYCEEFLAADIRAFECFLREYPPDAAHEDNMHSCTYRKWHELSELDLPAEIEKAAKIGLVYEYCAKEPPKPSFVQEDEKGKLRVQYESFVSYFTRKYLPITYGEKNPTTWIYDGRRYVENISAIRNEIWRSLRSCFTEAQIRSYAAEIVFRLQCASPVTELPFNRRTDLIPVRNCVLYYHSDRYIPLPHSPAYGFTYYLPVNYNPQATCPHIDKFISEIVEEDNRQILYEIPALCLLDERWPYAYILHGGGRNGKSTYLTLLRALLGKKNTSSVPLQRICDERFATSELFGKLANICADLPKRAVYDSGMFKQLTGGDVVSAEKKFRDSFEFANRAKLIFSCNEIPRVRDHTEAFWRRWIVVNFPHKFENNPHLIDELTTDEELSGFLNRVLDTRAEILRRGDVTKTRTIQETMNFWMMQSNPVAGFVRHCLEERSGEIPRDELYERYKDFCDLNSLEPTTQTAFAIELKRYIRVGTANRRIDGKLRRVWTGIRLRCSECGRCVADTVEGEDQCDSRETASQGIEQPEPEREQREQPEQLGQLEQPEREQSEQSERVCEVCGNPSHYLNSGICAHCWVGITAKAYRDGKHTPETVMQLFKRCYPKLVDELGRWESDMRCRECVGTKRYMKEIAKDGWMCPRDMDPEAARVCVALRRLIGSQTLSRH